MDFPEVKGYEIVRKIGEGGYGAVYLAISDETQQKVAIKVLTFRKDKDKKEAIKKFKEEVKILRKISNFPNCDPYLLCIIDFRLLDKKKEEYALITEYIHGNQLFDLINCARKTKHSLSEEDLSTLMTHLLTGLDHLHKKGVTHGDIKPENIMFNDRQLMIKLIDFGGSCILGDEPSRCLNSIILTRGFFDKNALVTAYNVDSNFEIKKCLKANDVYALGKTIWEIATLENAQEYDSEERDIKPISQYGYSKKLSNILSGLVNEDFKKRLTTKQALKKLANLEI